jgi:hypothetical protein
LFLGDIVVPNSELHRYHFCMPETESQSRYARARWQKRDAVARAVVLDHIRTWQDTAHAPAYCTRSATTRRLPEWASGFGVGAILGAAFDALLAEGALVQVPGRTRRTVRVRVRVDAAVV